MNIFNNLLKTIVNNCQNVSTGYNIVLKNIPVFNRI